jgi:hypothetical protein
MVVNGWGPGAENADHGKNSKAERLLEEHRASERARLSEPMTAVRGEGAATVGNG